MVLAGMLNIESTKTARYVGIQGFFALFDLAWIRKVIYGHGIVCSTQESMSYC